MLGALIESQHLYEEQIIKIKEMIKKQAQLAQLSILEDRIEVCNKSRKDIAIKIETNHFVIYIPHNNEELVIIEHRGTNQLDWDEISCTDTFIGNVVRSLNL